MKSLEELKAIAFKDGLIVSSEFLSLVRKDAYLAGLRKAHYTAEGYQYSFGAQGAIEAEITRAEKEGV